jgi:hypothetical protein
MTEKANEAGKISEGVLDLAAKLKGKIKVESDTGVGNAEDNLYKDLLPEGLTLKVVEQVKRHDRDFIAAGAQVFGDLAVEAMVKNKKLTEASVHIPMTKMDSVNYHMDRHRQYQNHLTGDVTPVDKYGLSSDHRRSYHP